MLVMTTIFTSKIEELPPTSDLKMLADLLPVPFLEVILRTLIECLTCSCPICESEDANKERDKSNSTEEEDDIKEDAFSGLTTSVWVGTGAKVSPQQVSNFKILKQAC